MIRRTDCYPFLIQVKEELESIDPVRPASLAPTPLFRATVPRMHLWPTTNTASTPNFEWEQPFVYTTPTARRQLPNFSREETPANTILGGLLDPQYDYRCSYIVSMC
jgi:hypothetical protein